MNEQPDRPQEAELMSWIIFYKAREQYEACCAKAGFLSKVITGKETISLDGIRRAREVFLQLGQCTYVFRLLHADLAARGLEGSERKELEEMAGGLSSLVTSAQQDLKQILSWLPPEPSRPDQRGA